MVTRTSWPVTDASSAPSAITDSCGRRTTVRCNGRCFPARRWASLTRATSRSMTFARSSFALRAHSCTSRNPFLHTESSQKKTRRSKNEQSISAIGNGTACETSMKPLALPWAHMRPTAASRLTLHKISVGLVNQRSINTTSLGSARPQTVLVE